MENYNGLTMPPQVPQDSQNIPTTTLGHPGMNEGYTHNPAFEFDEAVLYVYLSICEILRGLQALANTSRIATI